MRFLGCTIFLSLLGLSNGWSLEKENISVGLSGKSNSLKPTITNSALKKEVNITADEAFSGETSPAMLVAPVRKVSVIKKTELAPLLELVRKKHQAYLSINRYEKADKPSSSENQGNLKLKLKHDIKPTIHVVGKPLVLGGEGFGITKLQSDDYRLHFTFKSHIKFPPIYEVKKKNIESLDPAIKKTQSEKFLIFHRSGLNFSRQSSLFRELKSERSLKNLKVEQSLEEKTIHTKVEAVPDTRIFFDQNKETKIHLITVKKPLDLIYDDPAILKNDYQTLNSDGS